MISKAKTVSEYLKSLPEDRRSALEAVRKVILKNLDKGFEEGIQYGMIGYYVPHKLFPPGYHCDPSQPLHFGGLASQKNHMSIYLGSVYGSKEHEAWFRKEWAKSGKKLDMGKSCIRFKRLEDIPLDVIARSIARVSLKDYVDHYERNLRIAGVQPKSTGPQASSTSKPKTAKTPAGAKSPRQKSASKAR